MRKEKRVGGEREKGKEIRNKRDEDRGEEKEWNRKVETKERKTGSTMVFAYQRFVDFLLRILSKTSRLDYPRRTSRDSEIATSPNKCRFTPNRRISSESHFVPDLSRSISVPLVIIAATTIQFFFSLLHSRNFSEMIH